MNWLTKNMGLIPPETATILRITFMPFKLKVRDNWIYNLFILTYWARQKMTSLLCKDTLFYKPDECQRWWFELFHRQSETVEDFCQIKNPFPVGLNLFCICLGALYYFESVCVCSMCKCWVCESLTSAKRDPCSWLCTVVDKEFWRQWKCECVCVFVLVFLVMYTK